jgi:uncharacterized membrane protein
VRLKLILGLSACCLAVTLLATPAASARSCGRVGGVKVRACNASGRKARSIHGGRPQPMRAPKYRR